MHEDCAYPSSQPRSFGGGRWTLNFNAEDNSGAEHEDPDGDDDADDYPSEHNPVVRFEAKEWSHEHEAQAGRSDEEEDEEEDVDAIGLVKQTLQSEHERDARSEEDDEDLEIGEEQGAESIQDKARGCVSNESEEDVDTNNSYGGPSNDEAQDNITADEECVHSAGGPSSSSQALRKLFCLQCLIHFN